MTYEFSDALDDLITEWAKKGCTWDEIISALELAKDKTQEASYNQEDGFEADLADEGDD